MPIQPLSRLGLNGDKMADPGKLHVSPPGDGNETPRHAIEIGGFVTTAPRPYLQQ